MKTPEKPLRRNPWSFPLLVLTGIVLVMWVASNFERIIAPDGFTGVFGIIGAPFYFYGMNDPFGNTFTCHCPGIRPDWPNTTFLIATHNLDGSSARTVSWDRFSGLTYKEYTLKNDFVIPILAASLYLSCIYFWFRKARQNRLPQP